MNNVTPDQQTMLTSWQQHTYAEFVLKDAAAARATMTEKPLCAPLQRRAFVHGPASGEFKAIARDFAKRGRSVPQSDGCGIFASRPNTLRPNRATT
jgi:hypothetical protein